MPEDRKGVPGGARVKNSSLSERVIDKLLSEDMLGIPDRLKKDYLEPRLIDLAYDLTIAAVGMIFHRERRGGYDRRDERRGYRENSGGQNDYSRFSDQRTPARTNTRPSYDYGTIIFATRDGALDALDYLKRTCDQYHQVSVGALYWKANLTSNRYSDEYWGWTDLSMLDDRDVKPSEDGYIIDLPPVQRIRTR